MAKYNPELFKIAMANLTKQSFVPAPTGQMGGAPPGGDPMAGGAGGAPPMPPGGDPSMGGAEAPMPPTGGAPPPPIDPSMLSQMMAGPGGDPAAAGGGQQLAPDGIPIPEEPEADPSQDIKKHIKDVLTETGVIKAPKMKPEEQFQYMLQILQSLCQKMGVDMPPPPEPGSGDGKDKPAASGGSSSSSSSSSKPATKTAGFMSNGSTGAISTEQLSDTQKSSNKVAEALRKLRG